MLFEKYFLLKQAAGVPWANILTGLGVGGGAYLLSGLFDKGDKYRLSRLLGSIALGALGGWGLPKAVAAAKAVRDQRTASPSTKQEAADKNPVAADDVQGNYPRTASEWRVASRNRALGLDVPTGKELEKTLKRFSEHYSGDVDYNFENFLPSSKDTPDVRERLKQLYMEAHRRNEDAIKRGLPPGSVDYSDLTDEIKRNWKNWSRHADVDDADAEQAADTAGNDFSVASNNAGNRYGNIV